MRGAREVIFRVQDAEGRGPWKPGFSSQWMDEARPEWLPPIYDELNIHPHHLGRLVPRGMSAAAPNSAGSRGMATRSFGLCLIKFSQRRRRRFCSAVSSR